jgi:hypothetical protein
MTTSDISAMLREGDSPPFSRDGADVLADYLVGEGEPINVNEVCRYWKEYDCAVEAAMATPGHKPDLDLDDGPEVCEAEALDWLEDRFNVIRFNGGVLVWRQT